MFLSSNPVIQNMPCSIKYLNKSGLHEAIILPTDSEIEVLPHAIMLGCREVHKVQTSHPQFVCAGFMRFIMLITTFVYFLSD